MNTFLHRENFTCNCKNWPVVPFSLLRCDNTSEGNDTEYKLGFERWQIVGFGLNISDELIKNNISRPTLIWVRKPTQDGNGLEIERVESKSYYEHLSPYCHPLRKCLKNFEAACILRDQQVVEHLFRLLDSKYITNEKEQNLTIKKLPLFEEDESEERIIIHIKEYGAERIYFQYVCPCMNLTEVVYPVTCEGVVIALIMVGQLVEENSIDKIEKAFNINKDLCKKFCAECDGYEGDAKIIANNIDIVSDVVFNEILKIQGLYEEQLRAERRRIMDQVLDKLTHIQEEFSLYCAEMPSTLNSGIVFRDIQEVYKPARKYFRNSLDMLEDAFGVEQVRLYLNNDFDFECCTEGVFYKTWMKMPRGDRPVEYVNISGEGGVGDLFKDFKGEPPKPGLKVDDIVPKDPDWSVYIFENAIVTDEAGKPIDTHPLIMGIKYKGGYEGKKNYLYAKRKRLEETPWHNYVLSKFAIFARSVMLSIYLHKHSDTLLESRATTEHETGQVGHGLEGISEIFVARQNAVLSRAKENNPEFSEHLSEFLKQCEFFNGDVNGLFLRVRLTSKIYGDAPIPKAKSGDVYQTFLSKWKFAFFSNCRANNTEFYLGYHHVKEARVRKMYTDFDFLEHAIYNVVGNAIKHALKYSKITLNLDREGDFHLFTIINYGDYLMPDIRDVYKRGVRNIHGIGAPHVKGETIKQRIHVGMGMGLYIADKVIKALQGNITNTCEHVSDYNIPLLDYFFDKQAERGYDLNTLDINELNCMKDEYERLRSEGHLAECLAATIGGKGMESERKDELDKIPFEELITDLREPTYKVVFIIKVPTSWRKEIL